ncbi:MAG: hypothetical protein WA432_02185 [Candidatus Babeliaceae bacterium]
MIFSIKLPKFLLFAFALFPLSISGLNELPIDLATLLAPASFNPQAITDDNAYSELQLAYFIKSTLNPPSILCTQGLMRTSIPLNNREDVLRRQNIIRLLVENDDLFQKAQKYCQRLDKLYEPVLLSYWDPQAPLQKKAQQFYFTYAPKWFNNYGFILQAGLAGNILQAFRDLIQSLSFLSLEFELGNSLIEKRVPHFLTALKEGWCHPLNLLSTKKIIFKEGYVFPQSAQYFNFINVVKKYSGGDWYSYFSQIMHLPKALAVIPAVIVVGAWELHYYYSTIKSTDNLKNLKNDLLDLKNHLQTLAQFFQDSQQLTTQFKQFTQITTHPSFKSLFDVAQLDHISPKMQQVIKILLNIKIQSTLSVFQYGQMLLAHKLFQEAKRELIPLIEALQELEAYVHIANLIRNQQSATPFCFTTFTDDQKPFIDLTDFWLPLIPLDKVITNSITIGKMGAQNILFNGPHWCGKSISMKGIAYCILFSQAWGIAPARQATMSFFTGMRTAINITDSVIAGQSGFSAEKDRLEKIRTFVKTARPQDCYFILLDEPITKTNPDLIGSLIYNFGLEISQNPQCCTVMSCNHPRILELTETGLWSGFYVELAEPEPGNFERTYKIHPGISTWWTSSEPTDTARRTRFIDWVGKRI